MVLKNVWDHFLSSLKTLKFCKYACFDQKDGLQGIPTQGLNYGKYIFKTTFLEIRWKPQMIRPSFSFQNMYECVWNEVLDLFSFWYANLMNTVTEKGLVHLMYQTVLIFVNFFGQVCFTLVLYNIYADHTNIDDMMTKFVRLVIPIYYCILYSTYF